MEGPLSLRPGYLCSLVQLKIIPILDGQALLYSFAEKPEVHVGVSLAGGSSSVLFSDLPGVATWLVTFAFCVPPATF